MHTFLYFPYCRLGLFHKNILSLHRFLKNRTKLHKIFKLYKFMVTYVIYFSKVNVTLFNLYKLEYSNPADAFSMASKISQSDYYILKSLDVVKK